VRGFQQVLHHRQRVGARVIKTLQIGQRLGDFSAHQLFKNIQHPAAIGQAQRTASMRSPNVLPNSSACRA